MRRDRVLELCASLPGAVEAYPFGGDVALFRVEAKMFALVLLAGESGSVNSSATPTWRGS